MPKSTALVRISTAAKASITEPQHLRQAERGVWGSRFSTKPMSHPTPPKKQKKHTEETVFAPNQRKRTKESQPTPNYTKQKGTSWALGLRPRAFVMISCDLPTWNPQTGKTQKKRRNNSGRDAGFYPLRNLKPKNLREIKKTQKKIEERCLVLPT